MTIISREEVAALLRRIANDETPFAAARGISDCDIEVRAEGHLLVIFDDAGQADEVRWARWADGRETGCPEWWDEEGGDPLDLLTDEEINRLELALGIIEPWERQIL